MLCPLNNFLLRLFRLLSASEPAGTAVGINMLGLLSFSSSFSSSVKSVSASWDDRKMFSLVECSGSESATSLSDSSASGRGSSVSFMSACFTFPVSSVLGAGGRLVWAVTWNFPGRSTGCFPPVPCLSCSSFLLRLSRVSCRLDMVALLSSTGLKTGKYNYSAALGTASRKTFFTDYLN